MAALMAIHLSRLAEDLVMWASSEFGLNRYNEKEDRFELLPLDYTWECKFRPSASAPFDLLLGGLPYHFDIYNGRRREFDLPIPDSHQ